MMTGPESNPDLLFCFDPVINDQTHTLILGSFPSRASLEAEQYYAHRRNHFWKIMEALFRPVSLEDTYEDRLNALLSCGIGIWDVFASCVRSGSMDADIIESSFNDFSKLKILAPNLKRVVFNGRVAAKAFSQLNRLGYGTYVLPSTSPAYTIPFTSKLGLWCEAIAPQRVRTSKRPMSLRATLEAEKRRKKKSGKTQSDLHR